MIEANSSSATSAGEGRKCRLYIQGVPFDASATQLHEIGQQYGGRVSRCFLPPAMKIAPEGHFQLNRGYGYIHFESAHSAAKFLQLAEKKEIRMSNRIIVAQYSKSKKGTMRKTKTKQFNDNRQAYLNGVEIGCSQSTDYTHLGAFVPLPMLFWQRLFDYGYVNLPDLLRARRCCRQFDSMVHNVVENAVSLDLSAKQRARKGSSDTSRPNESLWCIDFLVHSVFSTYNWKSLRRLILVPGYEKVVISPLSVARLAKSLSTLEEVALKVFNFTNETFKKFVNANHNLRKVNISVGVTHSPKSGAHILSPSSINFMLFREKNLTHLSLGCENNNIGEVDAEVRDKYDGKVSNRHVPTGLRYFTSELSPACPRLQHLESQICAALSSQLVTLKLNAIVVPPCEMPCVKWLTISVPNEIEIVPEPMPDLDFSLVFKRCTNLESLTIIGNGSTAINLSTSLPSKITELGMLNCHLSDQTDWSNIRRLRALDISDSCGISVATVTNLLNQNPDIVRLGLQGFCDLSVEHLKVIVSKCPKLELLNVSDCIQLDHASLLEASSLRHSRRKASQGLSSIVTLAGIPPFSKKLLLCIAGIPKLGTTGRKSDEAILDPAQLKMLDQGGIVVASKWEDLTRIDCIVVHSGCGRNVGERINSQFPRKCFPHRSSVFEIENLFANHDLAALLGNNADLGDLLNGFMAAALDEGDVDEIDDDDFDQDADFGEHDEDDWA